MIIHLCLAFNFINCIVMVLKMQILYLKLQTKDHFWSPTHSEVVFLVILYHSNKNTFYCDLSQKDCICSKNAIFSLPDFYFAVFF